MSKIIKLSNDEKIILLSLVNPFSYNQVDYIDIKTYNEIISKSKDIPLSLKNKLDQFKNKLDDYIIIENLPNSKHSEILILISNYIGKLFYHEDEKVGLVTKNKCTSAFKDDEIAYYTNNEFSIHTELPYIEEAPDYLALICVDNVDNGYTYLSNLNESIKDSDIKEDIEILLENEFKVFIPKHFKQKNTHTKQRAILKKDAQNEYEIKIRFDNIDCKKEKMHSVNNLFNILDKNKIKVLLEKNQIIIINNKKALHGRSSFDNKITKRELRRVYITNDLAKYGDLYNKDTKAIKEF